MKETYYCKFINFFKEYGLYDERMFNYIWEHSILFDYLEMEQQDCIGIYYILGTNKKLISFKLVVPFINSEKTLFINIHEYIHAIDAYSKLDKKFRNDESLEVISLLFEKLYLLKNDSYHLNNYRNMLNNIRINSNDKKYIIGLKVADELINYCNKEIDFKKITKKSKILFKKYKYLR